MTFEDDMPSQDEPLEEEGILEAEENSEPNMEAQIEKTAIIDEGFAKLQKSARTQGQYALHSNRLVRVVHATRAEGHRGILQMWDKDVLNPPNVPKEEISNIKIQCSRRKRPKAKQKLKKERIRTDEPWERLGHRAQLLIARCHEFTEKLDDLISTAYDLPQAQAMSLEAEEARADANVACAIHKEFGSQRKFFEELYKDYFLVDIPNSTIVPESGDPEYYFVIQLKLLLGDMFHEDATYCGEIRQKAQTLKENLDRLADSYLVEVTDPKDAKAGWNILLDRFRILRDDHQKLNASCRALVEDYESMKTQTTPDSPRNEFQKNDEVRYWVPAMKKWVEAKVEEVIPGDSHDPKRGKIKLSYDRYENPSEPEKLTRATKWVSKWHSNLQPLPNKRESYRPPSREETSAIELCSYFQSVKYDIPIEAPLRLPKFYHEIDDMVYPKSLYEEPGATTIPSTGDKYHLMQQYYLNQYLPASHPARLRYAEQNGRDPYQDAFIQRASDSSRIMNTEVRFDYYDKNQPLLGSDQPMLNFWWLCQYKRYDKFRIAIHKAQVDYGKHKENYEMRIFRKYAYNFKITSNRTMDMFNARGFDMKYATKRIL